MSQILLSSTLSRILKGTDAKGPPFPEYTWTHLQIEQHESKAGNYLLSLKITCSVHQKQNARRAQLHCVVTLSPEDEGNPLEEVLFAIIC